MARTLKVYGASIQIRAANYKQVRVIVAAASFTEAANRMGCTPNHLKLYGAITGNDVEISTAMAKPGTVFYASNGWGIDFKEVPAEERPMFRLGRCVAHQETGCAACHKIYNARKAQ